MRLYKNAVYSLDRKEENWKFTRGGKDGLLDVLVYYPVQLTKYEAFIL